MIVYDPEFLISLYFNGNGAFEQEHLDQLSEWIKQSPQNAERFAYVAFLHRAIHDSLVSQDIQGNFLSGFQDESIFDETIWQALAEDEKTAPAIEIPKEKPKRELIQKVVYPPQEKRKMTKFQIFSFIVSAAAVLFVIAFPKIFPERQPEHQAVATVQAVATMTDSIDAEWTDLRGVPLKGDTFYEGEFILAKGFAELTFEKGAVVMLQSPCRIKLDGPNQMHLFKGKLSAQVPPEAYGFAVDTPDALIMDVGTEFGVEVIEGRSSAVHVFKGGVVLSLGRQGGTTQQRELVNGSQARRIRAGSKKIEKIAYESKAFVRSREEAIYGVQVAGDIRYLETVPNSLKIDDFESNDYMHLFLEKKRVVLEHDMWVALPTSGVPAPGTTSLEERHVIPAGTIVDSYLIHHDRNYTGTPGRVSGSIVFNRPVLGLIVSNDRLKATDSLLGEKGTMYPFGHGQVRGLEKGSGENNRDFITVSGDGKRLDVLLKTENIDQFRVLIAAPPDSK